MSPLHWTTLISAAVLHEHLHDTNLLIVDCRFEAAISNPANAEAGRQAYKAGHLPGAIYAHLDTDLSGPRTPGSGRHPLPSEAALIESFSRWGIDAHTQVVAYDAAQGAMAAARLWWLLRWLGHPHVAVLDGGLAAWQAAGFELSTSQFTPAARNFVAKPNAALLADATQVKTMLRDPQWKLIDARAPERFVGEVEPLDPVAGHIPGAVNRPFTTNLQADQRFQPAPTLHTQWQQLLGTVAATHTICMCGSGVTACHNLLAMEVAGLHGGKLYAGSWSEWCQDPLRPITKGH